MKTITLSQVYTIELPEELQSKSKEEIVNMLNRMYDINGKDIISRSLSAEDDYDMTVLTHIDDEEVFTDNCKILDEGHMIILDGQPLSKTGDKL